MVKWNDEKGFGFVRPESAEKDLFLHISVIKNYRKGLSRRPVAGDTVHSQPISRAEAQGKRPISAALVVGINNGLFGIDAQPDQWWSILGLKLLAGAPILLSFILFGERATQYLWFPIFS